MPNPTEVDPEVIAQTETYVDECGETFNRCSTRLTDVRANQNVSKWTSMPETMRGMTLYSRTYDILTERTTSLTEHITAFRERLTAAHQDFQMVDEEGQAGLQQLFQQEGWEAKEVGRILGELFKSPIFPVIPGVPGPISPFAGATGSGSSDDGGN